MYLKYFRWDWISELFCSFSKPQKIWAQGPCCDAAHALLELMIVGGIKASCVVLVKASCVPGEGEEEGLLMRRGRTVEEELSEGCKKGATVDRRGCIRID